MVRSMRRVKSGRREKGKKCKKSEGSGWSQNSEMKGEMSGEG